MINVFADSPESAYKENDECVRERLMCRKTADSRHCSARGEHAVSPTELAKPVALRATKSDVHGSKSDVYLLMDWTLLTLLCPLLWLQADLLELIWLLSNYVQKAFFMYVRISHAG